MGKVIPTVSPKNGYVLFNPIIRCFTFQNECVY